MIKEIPEKDILEKCKTLEGFCKYILGIELTEVQKHLIKNFPHKFIISSQRRCGKRTFCEKIKEIMERKNE